MNPPESYTVPGAGGTPVQYWIIKPPAFNPLRKYPVVFLIHGGPQGEWGDGWSARWNPTLWAAQGWVVVAPNPRGSFGFGQKFVDEITQDWGGKVMTDLTAVFDAAVKLPYVDARVRASPAPVTAGTPSTGSSATRIDSRPRSATTACSISTRWRSRPKNCGSPNGKPAAPPWRPAGREHVAKWSPHLYAQQIKTPTLVITNELDYRVPVDQGLQLFTALRRNGVPSKALVFPDEGHWVLKPLNSKRWHEEVFGWLKTYLK